MSAGNLACMTTPAQGNRVPPGARWAADNGKFGKGWPGGDAWFSWLANRVSEYDAALCLFATAPDEVGNAEATLRESRPWLPRVRSLGIPAAFVAQNGCTAAGLIPWGEFDVLFLGGDDEFKIGFEGEWAARLARARGVPVHMGRVNSKKRIRLAMQWDCATVDGTYLAFGPAKNLARLERWLGELGTERDQGASQ